MDAFLMMLCGFLPGILPGILLGVFSMSYLKKQDDLKGWDTARKYKDLYDQLMESTTALQDAIQEDSEDE